MVVDFTMGLFPYLIAVVSVLFAIVVYSKLKDIFEFPKIPKLENGWWGPGNPSEKDSKITPFKIDISENVLRDLQYRLENHVPFHPPLEGAKQHYGMNTNLLNTIVDFWKNKYDWRESEKFLNQFPQFKVEIEGLNIHYIHVKPKPTKEVKVLPLLLLHGWPGSVREFYEAIPILTTPQEGRSIVFEVIVPSLPGYGFSDGAVRPGLGPPQIANIFKNLMDKIGFERYYVQGGDWGALLLQTMASMFPDKIIGLHSNFCVVNTPLATVKTLIGSFFPSLVGIPKEQEKFVYPLSKKWSNTLLETGYFHIQATKPDTVGVALRDSPVGLAAYILEKFITGTNPAWKDLDDGNLLKKFTFTQLLDNVMIYWVTRSMTSAMRIYAENYGKNAMGQKLFGLPVEVPSGYTRFCYDLAYPDVILKERFRNLIHITDHEGGHFAALEQPQVFSEEVFTFVEKVEKLKSEL